MSTKQFQIKDLQLNLFVRTSLNEDHVLYLAALIEAGVQLPPIKITMDMVVVDGRHRIEAYELNGRDEIEAEIVKITDETAIIGEAYKANVGGSLPPTQQDTEHTIRLLLDRNETIKNIASVLALPPSMARKYVTSVKSKMARQKLMQARDAVAHGGITVSVAAEKYSVEADKLKEILGGGKRKAKGVVGIGEIQRNLTRSHKSLSSKNAALMRSVLEKYDDADISRRQVIKIIEHIEQLQDGASRAIAGWRRRFESAKGPAEK